MTANPFALLTWLAAALVALGLCLGYWQWRQHRQRQRLHQHMDAVLQCRQAVVAQARLRRRLAPGQWAGRMGQRLLAWMNTSLGRQLVAQEDKELLVQCGFQGGRGRLAFLLARLGMTVALPLLAWVLLPVVGQSRSLVWLLAMAAVGYLLPKWALRHYAARRCKQAEAELPLLVDLLGLLQGGGQGVDQSLQVIAQDFSEVLPVLSGELQMANRLYASGRTRDQAFTRMSDLFRSANLADLTALLVQIDRHGGAVQEPLRQFGLRLREQRRMRMKEVVGKVTVKMTGVMVLTLLPALLVITAGPGFLAVMRTLGGMK